MKWDLTSLIVIFSSMLSALLYSGCASSFPEIELKKDYDFTARNTITVYVAPSDNRDLNDTYARVMCLDLQARGYKVINANKELELHSDNIPWISHRQTANSIMLKNYLPKSDIIAVVRTKWDSIPFITQYSEQKTLHGEEVLMKGLNVSRLSSEVAFYDRSLTEPIMSFSAQDTVQLIVENENDALYYKEYPWMIIAKQLINNLGQIKICKNDNSAAVTNKFKVCFWVDKSYRDAFPNSWKERLNLRLLYANDFLRNQFGIQLVISKIIMWDSRFENSLDETLSKMESRPNSYTDMLRIGVTLDKKLKTNWTDRSRLGLSLPLTPNLIITAQPSFPGLQLWNPLEEAITIAHEVGHLFGAIHVTDPKSIMYPSAGNLSYEFDDLNATIINAMKGSFMKDDKEDLLKNYANTLINLKTTHPKNTVPILGAICSAFTNLYFKSSYQFQDPGKIDQFLSKIIPDSVYALAVAACFDYKMNHLGPAKELFSQAVKIDPEFAEAQWYLSVILQRLGEDKEAKLHQEITKPYVKYWIIDK